MLASHNVVMIQVVMVFVMSTQITTVTTVHAMPLAMTEMTAVQMQKAFACVSECQ